MIIVIQVARHIADSDWASKSALLPGVDAKGTSVFALFLNTVDIWYLTTSTWEALVELLCFASIWISVRHNLGQQLTVGINGLGGGLASGCKPLRRALPAFSSGGISALDDSGKVIHGSRSRRLAADMDLHSNEHLASLFLDVASSVFNLSRQCIRLFAIIT